MTAPMTPPNPANPDDAADPADMNDPNPIATVDPGSDSAPQTIDDTAGPDDPNARTAASMLDEAESRLDEAERNVADLLVGRMSDVPIDREDIVLSQSGDSTRPGPIIATPRAADDGVTAAVDMTRMGGFDADGDWHDSFGRYARKGWSALKHAALEALRDDPNRFHLSEHGPTRLRLKDRGLARRLGAGPDGMILARFGDAGHAVVTDGRGRPVRLGWDQFDRDQPMVRDRTIGERLLPSLPGSAPGNIMLGGAGPERAAANDLPEVGASNDMLGWEGAQEPVGPVQVLDPRPPVVPLADIDTPEALAAMVDANTRELVGGDDYSTGGEAIVVVGDRPVRLSWGEDATYYSRHDASVDSWVDVNDRRVLETQGEGFGSEEDGHPIGSPIGALVSAYADDEDGTAHEQVMAAVKAAAERGETPPPGRSYWVRTAMPVTTVTGGKPGDTIPAGEVVKVHDLGNGVTQVTWRSQTRTAVTEDREFLDAVAAATAYDRFDGPEAGASNDMAGTRVPRPKGVAPERIDAYNKGWNYARTTVSDDRLEQADIKGYTRNPDWVRGFQDFEAGNERFDALHPPGSKPEVGARPATPPDRPVLSTAPLPATGIEKALAAHIDGDPNPPYTVNLAADGATFTLSFTYPDQARIAVRNAADASGASTIGDWRPWNAVRSAVAKAAKAERGATNDLTLPEYGPDLPELHGPVHVLRGSRYDGGHTVTRAFETPGHPGWFDVFDDNTGWRNAVRREDMFPTEEAARAAARERRQPRRTGRAKVRPAYGDYATIALLNGINPQTGRKFAKNTETTISNTPGSTGAPGTENDLRTRTHTANHIRDLAYATNPNELPAITTGRPIIDVAYTTDDTTVTLTRTTGILTADNRYLTAATEPTVTLPLTAGDPYRTAEAYARSIAGDGAWARVRANGDLDGDLIPPMGGVANDMAVPDTWVPDPGPNGQFPTVEKIDAGSVVWDTQPDPDFPEDTRSALNIVTQYAADPNDDDPALNIVEARIFGSEGRYDWWVDGANAMDGNFLKRYPSDFGGAFDWPDPTQPAPWYETGHARTLPEAQAQALDAVNRLPLLETVRPIDMTHTVDGPNMALTRLKAEQAKRRPVRSKWSDPDPSRFAANLAEASADAPAESPWTPQRWTDPNQGDLPFGTDVNQGDLFPETGVSNDMGDLDAASQAVMSGNAYRFTASTVKADTPDGVYTFERDGDGQWRLRGRESWGGTIGATGDPSDPSGVIVTDPSVAYGLDATLARSEAGVPEQGVGDYAPTGEPVAVRPEVGVSNDLTEGADRYTSRSRLGGITVVVPTGMTGPAPVDNVIRPTPNEVTGQTVQKYEVNTYHADQPPGPDGVSPVTTRIAKRWTFDTPNGGIVVRHSGGTNYEKPSTFDLAGTRHGGSPLKPVYTDDTSGIVYGVNFGRLDIYPQHPRRDPQHRTSGPMGGSWGDSTPIGTVILGNAIMPSVLFSGQTDDPENYLRAEAPASIEGDEDAIARWAAETIGDPQLAYQRIDRASGVAAATRAVPTPHGAVVVRGTMAQPFFDAATVGEAVDRTLGDRYPGAKTFTAADSIDYADTKVLVLNEDSAARWKAAYTGVIAAQDAAKAERAAKAAARKAARQARQETIPDPNDLVDMPPDQRALAAVAPTGAWLIAKDNYLSRIGVERGQAVRVRADGGQGVVDVLDGDTVRAQPVKWDRFADTAPADAPKVDVPEVRGNAAVADKATAAQAVARRVQAAGTGGAPVEVADSYLTRYGAPRGSVITVSYLDDRNAVLNVDGRQVKAGWARFTPRVPEPDGQGGWNLIDPPEPETGAANDLPDESNDVAREMLRQIGGLTVAAISGGRREVFTTPNGDTGVRLPVSNGYRVDVIYDRASDSYTVNRVFSRGGRDFPKGSMSWVYADQLSDIAYLASSFRSHPFGTEPGAGNDLPDAQLSLLDLAPDEIRNVAVATTDFADHGWYPTDSIGGFRSPDGAVTVTRTPRGWKAIDTRSNAFFAPGEMSTTRGADAIVEWANQRNEALTAKPIDTAKLIDDDRLAAFAADPNIHLYPASDLMATGPRDRSRYGIVARSADGTFAEVIGRWKSPAEAQGAWDDLTRRLTEMGANDDPKVLDAVPPTLARTASVKATAVKRGDWVHSIAGTDGRGRVAYVNTADDGQVTIAFTGPDGAEATVSPLAQVDIARPVRGTAADPDVPTYTESASPAALAVMSPDQAAAVRSAAERVAQATDTGSHRHADAVRVVTDTDNRLAGGPTETIDGKTVDATSIVLDPHGAPPAPKAAPIPDGAVRLFHHPADDPKLDYTLDTGVTGRWAQTFPPVGDVVPYVEAWATPDEIAAGEPFSEYGHVALTGPLDPSRIVSYSTPTLHTLREFRAHPELWTADRLRSTLGRYPAGSPEHAAILARLAELGADLAPEAGAGNDLRLRPFALVRGAMTKVPDKAYLIALAATGVPNGNGRVPTMEEIEDMSPSELVALDRAMARWLASHPYGDYSGGDPLDFSVAADTTDEPDVEAPEPERRRPAPGVGYSGYVPMSPLDAPADTEQGVAAALEAEVDDVPILADLEAEVDDEVIDVPIVAGFDPGAHPRGSKGSPNGGKFVAKGGSTGAASRRAREEATAWRRHNASGGGQSGPTVIEGHFPEFPLRPANGKRTPAEEAADVAPAQAAAFFDRINKALDSREEITAPYDSIVNLADGMVKSGWQVAEHEPGVLRVTDPRNPGRYFDLRSAPRPARPGQ